MAFKLIRSVWEPETGHVKEFICDTKNDVANLPSSDTGSAALIASSGDVYIVNASGSWVKFGGGA